MASESFSSPFLQHARNETTAQHVGRTTTVRDAGAVPRSEFGAAQSESYLFSRLCALLERLEGAVNTQQQATYLTQFWQGLRRDESFFPFMRLLLPHLDNERAHYQLRESKLARLYLDILGISPHSSDGQRLVRWKDPSKSSVETTAFSDAIFALLNRNGGYEQRHTGETIPTAPTANSRGVGAKNEETPAHARDLKTVLAIQQPGVGGGDGFTGTRGMTVAGINRALDELANAADDAARRTVMLHLVRHTSAVEQKWLVRIILRDMRIRMTHQSMLVVFHPSALDVLNSTNDLRRVCDSCVEDTKRALPGSADAGIFLFQPLRPMLASPISAKKLTQMLEGRPDVVAQPKYDGERIMIHMDSEQVMYWTRNARNYTPLYAPKFDAIMRRCFPVGTRRRTPRGERTRASPLTLDFVLQNVILDGEFLVYDNTTKSFEAFGGNRTLALLGGDVGSAARNVFRHGTAVEPVEPVDGLSKWFCYMVFDVVMLNGASLLSMPFTERQSLLRLIIEEEPHHVQLVPSVVVHTTAEILSHLEAAIKDGNEGIVLKRAASPYVPAARKGDWIKMKPDHIAGLADSLDLMVVGGYYGTKFGSRSLSHFLLAAWDNSSSSSPRDAHARFHTFCKVGNGYTSDELQLIQTTLEPFWERVPNRQVVPEWLDGWKPVCSDLIPDVYVHPRHSLVLEVFGYAFTDTANYRAGYTIRFPRMLSIRWDKNLEDATNIETVGRIREASVDTLHRRLAQGSDELLTVMTLKWKRRRTGAAETGAEEQQREGPVRTRRGAAAHVAGLPPRALAVATEKLEVARLDDKDTVLDHLFDGYEFCVLFTSPAHCDPKCAAITSSRTALERCLLQHGAKVVANPGRRTSLLLASSASAPKVANWVHLCRTKPALVEARYAAVDIAHCDWVAACIDAQRVLPLTPRFMIFAGPALKKKFAVLLDVYEDSYTETCTVESLRTSLHLARQHSNADECHSTDSEDAIVTTAETVARLRDDMGLMLNAGSTVAAVGIAARPPPIPAQEALHQDPELVESWAVAWLRAVSPHCADTRELQIGVKRAKTEDKDRKLKQEEGAYASGEGDRRAPHGTASLAWSVRHAETLVLPYVVLTHTNLWSTTQLCTIAELISNEKMDLTQTPRSGCLLVDTDGKLWRHE